MVRKDSWKRKTPWYRSYAGVSFILLAVLAVFSLSLAVSLAAGNCIFLAVRYLLRDIKPGKTCTKYIVGGVVLSNLFLLIYTCFQNFIPFWDYAGYYRETLRCGALMAESIPAFFAELYQSMLESDYTVLPTLFIAPMHRLLGQGYTAYIFLIYNVFLVPFLILFSMLVGEIQPKCVPIIFIFTPFISPVLRGYLDGAGLIYVVLWLYLLYKGRFFRPAMQEDLVLGLLTVLLLFTRRWYLFFLVGVLVAAVLSCAVCKKAEPRIRLDILVKNLLICGGTVLFVVVVFFFPYLRRLFGNNLSEAYSAYMFGDFGWNVECFLRYYGFLPAAFSALGVCGIFRKKHRMFTLFLFFQILIMFFLFTRIQTVSYHHQYLFAAQMFLLAVIGIDAVPKCSRTVLIAYGLSLSVAFAYIYIPTPRDTLRNLFSNVRFAPKMMETEGILRLRDRLNELTETEGGHAYILASSEILNDDMLRNSMLPEKDNGMHAMLGTAHVDLRDGMPNHLFVSDFVVVAEPGQFHLEPENQQIIDFFVREILDGTYTPNLERIESIPLSAGVTAHIYRRNGGYTEEFLRRVQAHFNALYPEYPALFAVDFVWSQN